MPSFRVDDAFNSVFARFAESSGEIHYLTFSFEVKPPKSGPGFLRLSSLVYRLEIFLVTVIILVVLFYWRLFITRDLNVYLTLFWLVWPDLASFLPIGLAMRGSKNWPRWGSTVYNFFHTFLVWIPIFTVWSLITSTIEWPLLGWAAHITLDRSVGYYLRT